MGGGEGCSMTADDTTNDAELVAAILAGDPSSWGVVFDRYRDRVWQVAYGVTRRRADADDVLQATFLKAVESIDQLRDPAALRPWLLSIARRGALDSVRRVREVAQDPTDGQWDVVATTGDPLIAGLRQDDLAQLVDAAFDELEPRDRAALELAERQELTGDELAAALGVTRDNAYAMVHNARDRFGASVASLVVAREGRAECDDLDRLLDGWDGDLTPLLRKRVARHLKKCQTCSETRRLRVSPAALLSVLPVVAISTLAADQSRAVALESANGAAAVPASTGSASVGSAGLAAKVAVAAAVAVLAGAGWVFVIADDEPDAALAERADEAPAESLGSAETDALVANPASTSTSTPTILVVVDDYCTTAGQLKDFGSTGPASADPVDVEAYLTGVNSLLQSLVDVSDPASPTLTAYAGAYQKVVDTGVWLLSELADSDDLRSLADAVESEMAEACGTD
jgi:RNA polymerase sigma factor (sigma-70 family)